jgi:glucosamine--fructose-6-phosphate aminotransferase (isomerizing)
VSSCEEDVWAQGEVLHDVLGAYRNPDTDALRAARALTNGVSPVIFTGMGSSLSAVYPAAERLAAAGRPAVAREAGELLYYGMDSVRAGSLVVLVSQSGRSAETLALGRALRGAGIRIVAVVNDTGSPIAELADVVLPVHAGAEAAVATKTFVATFVTAHALADALSESGERIVDVALAIDLPTRVAGLAADPELASEAAEALVGVDALVVLGRGPSFAAADYGALITKEIAALPAEPMLAGSFRHGPIEIAGPSVGVIILAPQGATYALSTRLARETARLGSPTWLLAASAEGSDGSRSPLVVTQLPDVPEALAPILFHVPLQHLASRLALGRGREPGVLLRASKITAVEG